MILTGSNMVGMSLSCWPNYGCAYAGQKTVEMPGIEPGASHMQSVRSTTELHPPVILKNINQNSRKLSKDVAIDTINW